MYGNDTFNIEVVTPDWYLVNTEGHRSSALLVWKSVMDSLSGREAPSVVRCESRESQYATGIHNPLLLLSALLSR